MDFEADIPTLEDFNDEMNNVVQRAQGREKKYLQRVLLSLCFGPTKKVRYGAVMIWETDGSEEEVWFAEVLFMLCLNAQRDVEDMEVTFVQYMEVTTPWDKAEWTSGCLSVRWSTYDEKGYNVTKDVSTADVVEVRDWYGVELLESLMRTAHFVRAYIRTRSF